MKTRSGIHHMTSIHVAGLYVGQRIGKIRERFEHAKQRQHKPRMKLTVRLSSSPSTHWRVDMINALMRRRILLRDPFWGDCGNPSRSLFRIISSPTLASFHGALWTHFWPNSVPHEVRRSMYVVQAVVARTRYSTRTSNRPIDKLSLKAVPKKEGCRGRNIGIIHLCPTRLGAREPVNNRVNSMSPISIMGSSQRAPGTFLGAQEGPCGSLRGPEWWPICGYQKIESCPPMAGACF